MIAVHGPTVSLSAEEIAATQSDLNFYVWLLHDCYPTLQADAKAATTYNFFYGSNVEPNLRRSASRICLVDCHTTSAVGWAELAKPINRE